MRVVRIEPATWLPVSAWWQRLQNFERLRDHLALQIERAGWRESPERVAVLSAVLSVGLCALGLSASIFVQEVNAAGVALAGATAGAGAVGVALRSAIHSRRRRMSRELAPLLELFLLELGGGGSPLSALGSVTMQVDGELAVELRRLLITSQVAGSATFEPRLREYAERIDLSALSSLATILTASREYGTGVSQGVRALATVEASVWAAEAYTVRAASLAGARAGSVAGGGAAVASRVALRAVSAGLLGVAPAAWCPGERSGPPPVWVCAIDLGDAVE